jgi:hypothetical protein
MAPADVRDVAIKGEAVLNRGRSQLRGEFKLILSCDEFVRASMTNFGVAQAAMPCEPRRNSVCGICAVCEPSRISAQRGGQLNLWILHAFRYCFNVNATRKRRQPCAIVHGRKASLFQTPDRR